MIIDSNKANYIVFQELHDLVIGNSLPCISRNVFAPRIDIMTILPQACQNKRNCLFLKFCQPLECTRKQLTIFLPIIPSIQPALSNTPLILLGKYIWYVFFSTSIVCIF